MFKVKCLRLDILGLIYNIIYIIYYIHIIKWLLQDFMMTLVDKQNNYNR